MRNLFRGAVTALFLAAAVSGALAQSWVRGGPSTGTRYPAGAIPLSSSSGNQAAANAVATLTGTVGTTTYICGFALTSSGATAAAVVNPTVAGLLGGTQTYVYTAVAGVALGNPVLHVVFNPCLPASAENTSIVVTLPSLGSGNTNAAADAWGFRF